MAEIPQEAVEAATYAMQNWGTPFSRPATEDLARTALKAAQPFLVAQEREAREDDLTPDQADHVLTVYALAREVLRRAGIAAPAEPDDALAKLRARASSPSGEETADA